MSFYANPNVLLAGSFSCQECGWFDTFVGDDGDRIVSDHRCYEDLYEEDDDY